MAIIVQNQSGTQSGANAYVTVAEFKAYHLARGNDHSAYSDTEIEQAIVRGTDHLDERFSYVGDPLSSGQSTEWPRSDAYDKYDDYVEGIPVEVSEATFEYAFLALGRAELNPTPDRDGTGQMVQSKSETVGPISQSVEFVSGGRFYLPLYPRADRKLIRRGLVERRGRLFRG